MTTRDQSGERAAVRRVIRALRAAGFEPIAVCDGGEDTVKTVTETAMLSAIFSVDCSSAYFRKVSNRTHSLFVVLGNADDGSEVIADYSAERSETDTLGKEFAAVVDAVTTEVL